MEQIKKAQQGHPSIEGIKRKMSLGKASEFVTDNEGILWYGDRLCVPNIEELKQQILTESHTAPYSIHPGGTKMYKDIQERFWVARYEEGYSHIHCLLRFMSAHKSRASKASRTATAKQDT